VRDLAFIDTDVLFLLLDTKKRPATDPTILRRERALATIADLKKQGAVFVLSALVIVELSFALPGTEVIRAKLKTFLSNVRIASFGDKAGDVAGAMLKKKLKPRPTGKGRNEIKFDALIAASAHERGARWFVTGNAKDMRPLFEEISSGVQLVDIDESPTTRVQLLLAAGEVNRPGRHGGRRALRRVAQRKKRLGSLPGPGRDRHRGERCLRATVQPNATSASAGAEQGRTRQPHRSSQRELRPLTSLSSVSINCWPRFPSTCAAMCFALAWLAPKQTPASMGSHVFSTRWPLPAISIRSRT
jgi:predicted nucleic acid-binding protein